MEFITESETMFREWVERLVNASRIDDESAYNSAALSLDIEDRELFRTSVNKYLEEEGFDTALVGQIILMDMPSRDYEDDEGSEPPYYRIVDKLMDNERDLGQRLVDLYNHFCNTTSIERYMADSLLEWMRSAKLEQARDQGEAVIAQAVRDLFDTEAPYEISLISLPTFKGLPKALETHAHEKLSELEASESRPRTTKEQRHHSKMTEFYTDTLPTAVRVMREYLKGPSPDSDLSIRDKLTVSMSAYPIQDFLNDVKALPSAKERARELMYLNQFPANDVEAHFNQIVHLFRSTLDDNHFTKITGKKLAKILPPDSDAGKAMFQSFFAPDTEMVESFKDEYKEYMTMDYLIDIIQHQRNNPDSDYVYLATSDYAKTEEKALYRYEKALFNSDNDLTSILHDLSDRHPECREESVKAKAFIHDVATLINRTNLVEEFTQHCLKVIKDNREEDEIKNPFTFLQDAVNFAKPFLKKSMLDDLQETRNGRMLLDDIREINQAALQMAEYVSLDHDKAPLMALSGHDRIEKLTAEMFNRLERSSELLVRKQEIDDNTFDNTL